MVILADRVILSNKNGTYQIKTCPISAIQEREDKEGLRLKCDDTSLKSIQFLFQCDD